MITPIKRSRTRESTQMRRDFICEILRENPDGLTFDRLYTRFLVKHPGVLRTTTPKQCLWTLVVAMVTEGILTRDGLERLRTVVSAEQFRKNKVEAELAKAEKEQAKFEAMSRWTDDIVLAVSMTPPAVSTAKMLAAMPPVLEGQFTLEEYHESYCASFRLLTDKPEHFVKAPPAKLENFTDEELRKELQAREAERAEIRQKERAKQEAERLKIRIGIVGPSNSQFGERFAKWTQVAQGAELVFIDATKCAPKQFPKMAAVILVTKMATLSSGVVTTAIAHASSQKRVTNLSEVTIALSELARSLNQ